MDFFGFIGVDDFIFTFHGKERHAARCTRGFFWNQRAFDGYRFILAADYEDVFGPVFKNDSCDRRCARKCAGELFSGGMELISGKRYANAFSVFKNINQVVFFQVRRDDFHENGALFVSHVQFRGQKVAERRSFDGIKIPDSCFVYLALVGDEKHFCRIIAVFRESDAVSFFQLLLVVAAQGIQG